MAERRRRRKALAKRAFDIVVAALLALLLWPVVVAVALAILVVDGRPVLYPSERMRAPGQGFTLWKFRTMRTGSDDGRASGGHKAARVTRLGGLLRRWRLDELPQLWNILCGEMSFVGPRPPLRHYVEQFPELYRDVLSVPPGLTGLATLLYRQREEALLGRCASAAEVEALYLAVCVPAKARLDRAYLCRQSLRLDVAILLRTVAGLRD